MEGPGGTDYEQQLSALNWLQSKPTGDATPCYFHIYCIIYLSQFLFWSCLCFLSTSVPTLSPTRSSLGFTIFHMFIRCPWTFLPWSHTFTCCSLPHQSQYYNYQSSAIHSLPVQLCCFNVFLCSSHSIFYLCCPRHSCGLDILLVCDLCLFYEILIT